jgi:hypothetical protein
MTKKSDAVSLPPSIFLLPEPDPLPEVATGPRPPVDRLSFTFTRDQDWWRVASAGSGLGYERGRGERLLERAEASPSNQQWQRFWSTVERIGAWKWADSFQGEGSEEHWLLQLARGDRRLSTGGRSAFPPLAEARPTPQFLTLCGAISQLVGVLLPFP